MKTYSELLKDPRWQRRRLEILERARFCCEECEDDTSTLHVHHRSYRKGAMPWEYRDDELQCLCEGCHKHKTQCIYEIKNLIGKLHAAFLDQLLGYCESLLYRQYGPEYDPLLRVRGGDHAEGLFDAVYQKRKMVAVRSLTKALVPPYDSIHIKSLHEHGRSVIESNGPCNGQDPNN